MSRRFKRDASGITAIEFAIVCPVLFSAVFGAIGLGLLIWYTNILENVTADTARCIAVDSPFCSTVPVNCAGDSAPFCYASQLAAARGLVGLKAAEVSVDPNVVKGSAIFTAVTIRHEVSMLGYDMILSATNSFPNSR